jgi:nucleoside-diphosphate-sugar epimerase
LAEKEAWKIAGAQSRWDLVVINPSFVLGPNLSLSSDSESIQFMGDIVKGKFAMGAPALYFGFVDVRDVAQAHLLAAENIKAEGRYLLAERCASVMDLTTVIAQEFPNKYKLPKSSAPKPLMWLMGPVFGVTRKFISKNVGFPIQLNTSRSTEKLGVKYTPFNETVRDMILRIEH